jgi:hypothetical protein
VVAQELLRTAWEQRAREREAELAELNQERAVSFDPEYVLGDHNVQPAHVHALTLVRCRDDTIARVRKESVFKEAMTEQEQRIVDQRVAQAQQRVCVGAGDVRRVLLD